MSRIALAGNPNCGKTTLFNLLTGSDCRVGNWPGVTVERREGKMPPIPDTVLVDLPGIYSLRALSDEEGAALGFLTEEKPELIINIIDPFCLERSLYLTVQLIMLGIPVVAAVNMADVLEKSGGNIDCRKLSELLGIPVVSVSAADGRGLDSLISAVSDMLDKGCENFHPERFFDRMSDCFSSLVGIIAADCERVGTSAHFTAFRLLRGDMRAEELSFIDSGAAALAESLIAFAEADCDRELMTVLDIYGFADKAAAQTLKRGKTADDKPQRADRLLLGKYSAVPFFALTVLFIFYLTFGSLGVRLGEIADSFINGAFTRVIVDILNALDASDWAVSLVCRGVLAGLGSVCSFLPQIALLFLFIGVLEDCGYMARGAFIADRPLRAIGLGGKSFLPLFMGFGCSVPALMSTKTLNSGREKKICAAMIPFMSCSAKMPVYAMLISAFFPSFRWVAVVAVYSLGILCACVGSLVLKKFVFHGEAPPFILELPNYRRPSLRSVTKYVAAKLRDFLKKAGAVLLPASVIVWALGYFDVSFHRASVPELSLLGRLGNAVSFVFEPLGFGDWRCSVAVLSGLVARETTVSTLGILVGAENLTSIFTPAAACSFMSFSLLSMPCIAAVNALVRENGLLGTLKVLVFEFITAWTVSFAVYRLALLI